MYLEEMSEETTNTDRVGTKYKVSFSCIDPYTWQLNRKSFAIKIGSEEAARKWVMQNYHRVMNVNVEEVYSK